MSDKKQSIIDLYRMEENAVITFSQIADILFISGYVKAAVKFKAFGKEDMDHTKELMAILDVEGISMKNMPLSSENKTGVFKEAITKLYEMELAGAERYRLAADNLDDSHPLVSVFNESARNHYKASMSIKTIIAMFEATPDEVRDIEEAFHHLVY